MNGNAVNPAAAAATIRHWYFVAVLGLVNALSQADRAAINLIVNPLKADLQISDTQISLLIGLSFIILFSVLSVPAGYIVDRVNRRGLLGAAIVFWSVMEALCGFARTYWALFAARTGLGVGEAVVAPATYSLIRDGVAARIRARAFAIYHSTGLIGTNAGTLIGGALFGSATEGALQHLPIVGDLKPWQVVLVVPGFVGMFMALLLLTIPEPKRAPVKPDETRFREAFRYVGRHWRLYTPIFGGFVLICFASYGWTAWLAASIGRTWGLSPAQIGRTAGTIGVLLSPISAFLLAYLMDFLKSRGYPSAPFRLAAASCFLNICAAIYVLTAPSVSAMWVAYVAWTVFNFTGVGNVCSMMLVEVTPGHLVGKVTSLYFLFAYVLGAATGPTVFALVSQHAFEGPGAITDSMLACYPATLIVTIGVMFLGAHEVRRRSRTIDPNAVARA